MIRTNGGRRGGRPFGCAPVFLADCVRLDATTLLAKSRGARFDHTLAPARELSLRWTLQWIEGERPQSRTVVLTVTASAQHLGGVRCWWRCPECGRRCRVLLAVAADEPLGCRVCQRARYSADYAARHRRRRFVALVHGLGSGRLDVEHDDTELDLLLARDAAVSAGAGASSCGLPARWSSSEADVTPSRTSSMEVCNAVDHHDRPSLRPLRADRR
jgi:hypothetical protein